MGWPFHDYRLNNARPAVRSVATVLSEVLDETIHVFKISGIDYEAPLLPVLDKSRSRKVRKMKRERRGR